MSSKKFSEIGIDVSHWQRAIDFTKVKNAGIDFVIIKAGGSDKGFYTDNMFENNYRLAKLAGLKVGAYYYAGKNFTNIDAGIQDAKRFLCQLRGKTFDYPVFIDIEETDPKVKEGTTEAAIAFCEYLESYMFFVGIYASDISGFKERLEIDKLKAFTKWVAKYSKSKPSYVKNYGIWQYSSKGKVDGIKGDVDLDISSIDYSAIIHSKQLNRG